MNQKKPFKSPWKPEFLHEFEISSTGKTYRVSTGTWVSVTRRPGLMAGKYRIEYAEKTKDGILLIQVTGPVSRSSQRYRLIRETDIKQVHIKTRAPK